MNKQTTELEKVMLFAVAFIKMLDSIDANKSIASQLPNLLEPIKTVLDFSELNITQNNHLLWFKNHEHRGWYGIATVINTPNKFGNKKLSGFSVTSMDQPTTESSEDSHYFISVEPHSRQIYIYSDDAFETVAYSYILDSNGNIFVGNVLRFFSYFIQIEEAHSNGFNSYLHK